MVLNGLAHLAILSVKQLSEPTILVSLEASIVWILLQLWLATELFLESAPIILMLKINKVEVEDSAWVHVPDFNPLEKFPKLDRSSIGQVFLLDKDLTYMEVVVLND